MTLDVLIFGDTFRSPELRRELPAHIHYPGLYVEHAGERHAYFDWLEVAGLRAQLDDVSVVPLQDLGLDELVRERGARPALLEVLTRACARSAVTRAVVPREFPLDVADHLRASGIEISVDGPLFDRRRRSKSAPQIEGIRRAQHAAERAMEAIRDALAAGERSCDALRARATRVLADHGAKAEVMVISHGAQTANPLDLGSGTIRDQEPVLVDLFPRDVDSWCFADMTRTFCIGEPPSRLVELHAICDEARRAVLAAVRPGASTAELARTGCDVLRAHGFRTFLDAEPGETIEEGAVHVLGHGVGLEMIEEPQLWVGDDEIVAGDVFSIEPGLYIPGWGGCRIEDLVLVTETGAELLTAFPYTMSPSGGR